MNYTGAQITIKLLEQAGIDTIAGIPGGSNLPLYDALSQSSIKHILTRHEQAAGFIAQGIARTTGKPAVCFATSGPGATNLLTAIADAKLDSIPIIAITGQVPSTLIGTDAFQEVDTYGMSLPVTKHNFLARSAEELMEIIPQAFKIASSGRPGPVLIDIPKDIQKQTADIDLWPDQSAFAASASPQVKAAKIEQMADMINKSQRPLLYIGGGAATPKAAALLAEFAEKNNIPATCTLMGLGCFPSDHRLYCGMLGMHGARYTNMLLGQNDMLLAFGARFDDRATGNAEKFCPQAGIVHIDIDGSEIGKIKTPHCHITADLASALEKLIPLTQKNERTEWINKVNELKSAFPFEKAETKNPFHPQNLIAHISKTAGRQAIVTTDVGQHQMWTAQHYPFYQPGKLLTSGGLGTMGFGLPTAIGAGIANPDKTIICISGDGSFLMNIQELATLAETQANVKIVIMNNQHLGLVRQQQEMFYGKNYIASKFENAPDFAAIAAGFGIKAFDLANASNPAQTLEQAINTKGPCVVNAPVCHTHNVTPIVTPGAANLDMIGA